MAGAQTTINNRIKAATAMATEAVTVTVTRMTTTMTAKAAVAGVGSGGNEKAGLPPWLGNPFGIPQNYAINPIPDLLNSRNFVKILFFQS
jgi:hypothetical protein